MLGVVVSRADDASVHIGEHLLDLAEWERVGDTSGPDPDGGGTVYTAEGVELREFEDRHLDLVRPADAFGDIDLLVFASKHAGETGRLLTAHHTGNFGPADHGGDPNDLARACPNAHARVLDALAVHAPEGYEVGMECTHHGPTNVGVPSMFVEVGSTRPEWKDPDAARAVARAILSLREVTPDRESERGTARGDGPTTANSHRRHLVGVGGGHYAPRFERVVRETDWAVGHVAADWGLDALGDIDDPRNRAVIERAFDESRATYALVDGDGDLAAAVEAAGGEVVSETWVRETDGVPLGFVHAVEADVLRVDEGLRFGDPATGYSGDFVVLPVPEGLLDEARGIDRGATRATVEELTLAFGTDQGGTRVTGPVVLSDEADREELLDRLLDVLRDRYDSVTRQGAVAVARERAFDPDRARTLGVPEGPKFGRLADGQSVDVDGREIPPEAVVEERERRFCLDG